MRLEVEEMNRPGSPRLRRSGNLGRHSTRHLGEEPPLQNLCVGHESFGVQVFSAEVVGEIGVVGVGHPVEGILQRNAMN